MARIVPRLGHVPRADAVDAAGAMGRAGRGGLAQPKSSLSRAEPIRSTKLVELRAAEPLAAEITLAKWRQRSAACRAALERLAHVFRRGEARHRGAGRQRPDGSLRRAPYSRLHHFSWRVDRQHPLYRGTDGEARNPAPESRSPAISRRSGHPTLEGQTLPIISSRL